MSVSGSRGMSASFAVYVGSGRLGPAVAETSSSIFESSRDSGAAVRAERGRYRTPPGRA
jgi:hypothetical protein